MTPQAQGQGSCFPGTHKSMGQHQKARQAKQDLSFLLRHRKGKVGETQHLLGQVGVREAPGPSCPALDRL